MPRDVRMLCYLCAYVSLGMYVMLCMYIIMYACLLCSVYMYECIFLCTLCSIFMLCFARMLYSAMELGYVCISSTLRMFVVLCTYDMLSMFVCMLCIYAALSYVMLCMYVCCEGMLLIRVVYGMYVGCI